MTATTVVGAPDYSRPPSAVPRTLIDTTLSLGAGTVDTPWTLCEQFTGLIVEIQQITAGADFGLLQVQFSDVNGAPAIEPTYVCNWRGNKAIKLNVPVMGQRVRFHFAGAPNVFPFGLSVVGHGGGGHPGYGRNATVLASVPDQSIAAGATVVTDFSLHREGPCTLDFFRAGTIGAAWVTRFDATGTSTVIADVVGDVGMPPVASFWLPPDFCQLSVSNAGAAADFYRASVTLGRM